MNYSRRRAVIVIGGAVAGVALNAVPGRAATQPTITSAGNGPDFNGKIAVFAYCASPIVAVTAHIYVSAGGTEIATVNAFELDSGTDLNGSWRSRDALLLPNLGDYWATWEVRSADGGVAVAETAFRYWAHAEITIGATPMTVDAEHRSVVASGRVMARHPGTLQLSPLADFPVGLMVVYHDGIHAGYATAVTSDADGNFSAVQVLATSAQIWAGSLNVPERFVWYSPQAETPMITMNVTPTRLTLQADATEVVKGTTIEVQGRLERQVDGAWVAFTGQRVVLNTSWDYTGIPVTTDATGRFTASFLPPAAGTVNAYFNNDPYSGDPYFAQATAGVEVRVLYPISIVEFTGYGLGGGRAGFFGYVAYPNTISRSVTELQIQYQSATSPQWTTIGTTHTTTLDSRGYYFSFGLSGIEEPIRVRVYVAAEDVFLACTSREIMIGSMIERRSPAPGPVVVPRRG